jgi:hypothetical protein
VFDTPASDGTCRRAATLSAVRHDTVADAAVRHSRRRHHAAEILVRSNRSAIAVGAANYLGSGNDSLLT